jgi:hypothetical protein
MGLSHLYRGNKIAVPVILPALWIPELNQLASQQGITRSALIREAIAAMYFGGGNDPDPTAAASVAVAQLPQTRERRKQRA